MSMSKSSVVCRMGLSRVSESSSRRGGFQKAKDFPPKGEPSLSTTVTGRAMSFSKNSTGLAMVAEQQMNWGVLP